MAIVSLEANSHPGFVGRCNPGGHIGKPELRSGGTSHLHNIILYYYNTIIHQQSTQHPQPTPHPPFAGHNTIIPYGGIFGQHQPITQTSHSAVQRASPNRLSKPSPYMREEGGDVGLGATYSPMHARTYARTHARTHARMCADCGGMLYAVVAWLQCNRLRA